MAYYYHTTRQEVRDLDPGLIAAWQAAGNPKAADWTAIPDPPPGAARYDGTQWVVPSEADILAQRRAQMVVSRFQARAALLNAGLLDEVETIIGNPATSQLAKLAWDQCVEFKRTSPTLTALAQALGMTDAQLDALFEAAAGIEA